MVLIAQLRLSVEEYTVLSQTARKEGTSIQVLLARRFQDLVDKEIETALGGKENDENRAKKENRPGRISIDAVKK